jgi:2-keto-4-pentenoate hydratase
VKKDNSNRAEATGAHSIASRFVEARRAAQALTEFPGAIPRDLDEAYRCQDEAIALWPDAIAGWKIGRIASPWLERYGEERVVGPVFRGAIRPASGAAVVDFPVFAGGFAAVEAEFVFRLGRAAAPAQTSWTADQAAALVDALHIGVETAGSPLATINALGPAVVAADFGNNAGLILGPEIADWRARDPAALATETFIDGRPVGKGGAAVLPGGPLGALAFLLARNARRGRPLRAGDLVATGATTGIHDIRAGARARIEFAGHGVIECRAVSATPLPC